jgi:hypothetical protein
MKLTRQIEKLTEDLIEMVTDPAARPCRCGTPAKDIDEVILVGG